MIQTDITNVGKPLKDYSNNVTHEALLTSLEVYFSAFKNSIKMSPVALKVVCEVWKYNSDDVIRLSRLGLRDFKCKTESLC